MALLHVLYNMQQNGEWCDLHFVTNCGKTLQAHACVVSAASSKLKEMIKLGKKNTKTMVTTVHLPNEIGLEMMRILLQFIYFSKIKFGGEDIHGDELAAQLTQPEQREGILKVASSLGIELDQDTHKQISCENVENSKLKRVMENTQHRTLNCNTSKSAMSTTRQQEKVEQRSNENRTINACTNSSEQTESRIYSCNECDKQFKYRKTWQLHMNKFHYEIQKLSKHCDGESGQQELNKRTQHRGSRSICTLCNKSFTNVYVMQLHLRTHTGEERFSCPICLKKFPYKSSLTTHMLIHSDEKAYICSVCGKSFRQKIHAKEHESRHSGEKRHNCTACSKSFAQKSGLLRHINDIHQKLRPFVCETCGRSFSRKVKLTEHRRIHTGEKPYVCRTCGSSYKSNRSLKNHKKSKHGIIVPDYEVAIWK